MADQDKCVSLEDIDHNLGCSGGNTPGIVPRVIYGYWDDVAVWPDEPKPAEAGGEITPATLEEYGALTGDVVMKPGTRAFHFDFTEDAGNFSMVPDGEVDGMSVNYNLNIVKAKIVKKVLGLMNAAMGRKMFFIVQDENGNYYLMGNKRRGCSFVGGGDGANTGTGSGDRNQTTLQFAFRSGMALIYEGDVEDILILVPVGA
jgi:hypothetical protein